MTVVRRHSLFETSLYIVAQIYLSRGRKVLIISLTKARLPLVPPSVTPTTSNQMYSGGKDNSGATILNRPSWSVYKRAQALSVWSQTSLTH
jgi:hypothetical protein